VFRSILALALIASSASGQTRDVRAELNAGLLDTLEALVGRPVYAVTTGAPRAAGTLGGEFVVRDGAPTLLLSEHTLANARVPFSGYRKAGYVPVDSTQTLGEYVVGHEFGHMAVRGTNYDLVGALLDVDADAQHSEAFADNFQNAVQFLRSRSTDTSKLSAPVRGIVSVLLRETIFARHPLNVRVATDR
jgi:hypothetical protein